MRAKPKTYKGKFTKRQIVNEEPKSALVLLLVFFLVIGSYLIANKSVLQSYAQNCFAKQKSKKSPKKEVVSATVREVTAYNAGDPNQCDNSPCIAYNGENICNALAKGHKRCATNAFPIGTHLHIENYGQCLVVDRMNSRYENRVDIAFPEDQKKEAINWGLKKLEVKVIEYRP